MPSLHELVTCQGPCCVQTQRYSDALLLQYADLLTEIHRPIQLRQHLQLCWVITTVYLLFDIGWRAAPCFCATIPTPGSTLLACLYCERGQMEEPRKGGGGKQPRCMWTGQFSRPSAGQATKVFTEACWGCCNNGRGNIQLIRGNYNGIGVLRRNRYGVTHSG